MIKKRDGSLVDFDINRIIKAVFNAFKQTGKDPGDYPLSIGILAQNENLTSVESIQTFVENQLMTIDHDVARNYITYRFEHDTARKQRDEWARLGIDIITGADTESQRENSNVPRDTVTTKVEMIKRLYSKKFVSDFILPEKFKKAHDKGEIHVHDAGDIITKVHNCVLMDYPYMLKNGFQLGNKWIENPHTILTAMNVLVQMVQVQSNLQFGK